MPGPRQLVPYSKWDDMIARITPGQIVQVPVTNITYAQAELTTAVPGLKASCATGAASAIFDIDLALDVVRSTSGLGVLVKDLVLAYQVNAQALTGQPALTLNGVDYAAVGAAGAAPTVAAKGGSLTTNPGTLPTAVSTAGQQYSAQWVFGTPYRMNTDLETLIAQLTVPLAVGGNVILLGGFLHYTWDIAQ